MTATTATAHVRPEDLDAALDAKAEHPDWSVLAGGTDLMVPGPQRTTPAGVIDVFSVPALHGVRVEDDVVRIGACTTFSEMVASAGLRAALPLLHDAAKEIGAVQIRNRGTIGGNVITSSPVGDMLPGLLALDAYVVIASARAQRIVPYEAFLVGYRTTAIAPDELLVAVDVPVPRPRTVQSWRKVGARRAQAISKVSVAAAARIERGTITECRFAFGAVADRPVRVRTAEAIVEGAKPSEAIARAVEAAVTSAVDPIDDVRSTAGYRGDVAGRLAARFVLGLAG